MTPTLVADPAMFPLFLKLSAAIVCGALIGMERTISHKSAGLRTYALVSMGAALFVIVGDLVFQSLSGQGLMDGYTFHLAAAVISGVGFMGAGMIIFRESNVTGLTSASGFWVAAGIGLACGYGFYTVAFMATLLILFVFVILWHVEKHVKVFSYRTENDEEQSK